MERLGPRCGDKLLLKLASLQPGVLLWRRSRRACLFLASSLPLAAYRAHAVTHLTFPLDVGGLFLRVLLDVAVKSCALAVC
jgi:hypothetical protein